MPWRRIALQKNGSAARRRILAKIGPLDTAKPTHTPPATIRPIPPIFDDFSRLAQQNLNRLLTSEQEKLTGAEAAEPAFKIGHGFNPAIPGQSEPEGDGQLVKTENEDGVAPISQEAQLDHIHKRQSNQDHSPPVRFHSSLPSYGGWSTNDVHKPNTQAAKRADEDDTLHQDLDLVLKDFRALHDQISSFQTALSGQGSESEPQNLQRFSRTSPRAGRHYFDKQLSRSRTVMRGYSTLPETARDPCTDPDAVDGGYTSGADKNVLKGVRPVFMQGNTKLDPATGGRHIREHLLLWQGSRNSTERIGSAMCRGDLISSKDAQNSYTQSNQEALPRELVQPEETEHDPFVPNERDDDQIEDALSVLRADRYLRQGDLAEIKTVSEPVLAIFIRHVDEKRSLFYSEFGTWIFKYHEFPQFSVANFIEPSMLNDIIWHVPTSAKLDSWKDPTRSQNVHAPRHAGAHAMNSMQNFRKASESLYRQHAERLNRAYEILAPETYTKGIRTLSLQEVTKNLFLVDRDADLTPAMLWTAHKALYKIPNVSTFLYSHRQNPHFDFIPKQNLYHMQTVQKWLREFQERSLESSVWARRERSPRRGDMVEENPIATFAEKARRTIMLSRQKRSVSPTGNIGPDLSSETSLPATEGELHSSPISFDRNDKMIMNYLDAWVTAQTLNTTSPMNSIGPALLRAVGLYGRLELNKAAGFTLLQELGMVSPWQNPELYSIKAALPGYSPFHSVTKLRKEAQRQLSNLEMKDSMADFRKDWGDLPVYCIDSAGTMERDDGISVEDVPGEPTESWLHVHVANPTAFIGPKSIFAQYAAKMSETVYLPELKLPMLEPDLTARYLSLASGRPCITFSAKVSQAGEILEINISHGTVRNVYLVTHEDVSKALGNFQGPIKSTKQPLLTVGVRFPRHSKEDISSTSRQLTPDDAENLRRILVLGKANATRREGSWTMEQVFRLSYDNTQAKVYLPDWGGSEGPPSRGDPVISVVPFSRSLSEVEKMVISLMVLAGQICAKWCMDRQIPVPFRGFRLNPETAPSFAKSPRNIVEDMMKSETEQEMGTHLTQLRRLGSIDWSASPLQHVVLNLQGYVKATSPLRRYSDLLTHWQLEAAMRRETQDPALPSPDVDSSSLPFSGQEIESACKQIALRDYQIRDLQNKSRKHWIISALFRAYYFREASLPEYFIIKLEEYAYEGREDVKRGRLLDWGITVGLSAEPELIKAHNGYQINDVWEAQISEIILYNRTIVMKPTRLLERQT